MKTNLLLILLAWITFLTILFTNLGCGEVTVDNEVVDARFSRGDTSVGGNTGNIGGNDGGTNISMDTNVSNSSGGITGSGGVVSGQGGGSGGQGGVISGTAGAGGGLPVNSHCQDNLECASGRCINESCATSLKINGDGCSGNSQCVSNWCHPVLGICQNMPVLRNPGESCAYDWECNGFCNDATIPNTCHVTYNSGYGPCTRNTQCGSGSCDIGRRICN